VSLAFEQEIASFLLSLLLPGDGSLAFQNSVPFITSVGRVTHLIQPDIESAAGEEKWLISDVANGFTTGWYRPTIHLWEWNGQTVIRIIVCSEYDITYPVKSLKKDISDIVQEVLR
jgi:hypothetical protein